MYRPARDIDLLFFYFLFSILFLQCFEDEEFASGDESKRGRGDDYGFYEFFFDLFWLVWPSYQHHLLL
jgi:hypothetical protein